MRWHLSSRDRLGLALGASSLVSIGFFVAGVISNHDWEYAYLIWNLFLAWIPLILVMWLERILQNNLWSSWLAIVVTLFWLGFLPNSFYIISDFIHIQEVPRVDIVFDATMIASFAINGLIMGYISLFIVHIELRRRISVRLSNMLIAGVLLLASFAIYIGRDLRWNTWDVIFNPASLLFDISDRLLNAGAHPQVISTTLSFLVLLGSIYVVIWHGVRALRQQKMPG
jgi:uncharacterized membrane protein